MHALTAWLCAQLPAPGEPALVVAGSQGAASAQRRALLAAGRSVLAVTFTSGYGLPRVLLRMLGAPPPPEPPDAIVVNELIRARLAHELATGRALAPGLVEYMLRFPHAASLLIAAARELSDALAAPTAALSPDIAQIHAVARMLEEVAPSPRELWDRVAQAAHAHPERFRDLRALCSGDPRDTTRLVALGLDARSFTHAGARPPQRERISATSAWQELRLAASRCFVAHAAGTPWHAMVIALPTIAPYARLLDQAFAAEGVPFVADTEAPLAREPRGALALHAARAWFGAAPRASWLALAGSNLRKVALTPEVHLQLERGARDTDAHGRGEASERLRAELPALPVATTRAGALGLFLDALLARPEPGSRDARADERLRELLFALQGLERAAPQLDDARFVEELEGLLRTRGLPLASETADGVRIVEYDQALDFPCARLHLLGLQSGLVPGAGPSETFLRDHDRRAIPGLDHHEADRLAQRERLRALALHPTEALVLSRARTDDRNREVSETGWIAVLAEALGALPEPESEPTHPKSRAMHRIATARTCTDDVALIRLALARADRSVFAALDPSFGDVSERARALERFGGGDVSRDGVVVPDAELAARLRAPMRVTELQRLAACPQQHLFAAIMGIEPLAEAPEPLAIPRHRLGTMVHRALKITFLAFRAQLAACADPLALADQITQRALAEFARELREDGGPLARDYPGIHASLVERWSRAVHDAILFDLRTMKADHSRPLHIEHRIAAELDVVRVNGEPRRLDLTGTPDRVDRLQSGELRILDFKTGHADPKETEPREILSGRGLQLVAYAWMLPLALHAEPRAKVAELEVRRVNPTVDPSDPHAMRPTLNKVAEYLHGKHSALFRDTLAVLAELRASGMLVLESGRHCVYCDFRLACRRLHAPSVERTRTTTMPEVRRYRELTKRTSTSSVAEHP